MKKKRDLSDQALDRIDLCLKELMYKNRHTTAVIAVRFGLGEGPDLFRLDVIVLPKRAFGKQQTISSYATYAQMEYAYYPEFFVKDILKNLNRRMNYRIML